MFGSDMRSFYTTYKHIRVFVLGVPESWHVALYDLQAKKWLDVGGSIDGTLRNAKQQGLEQAAAIIGRKVPELKWH
jgi:hypothetical protein